MGGVSAAIVTFIKVGFTLDIVGKRLKKCLDSSVIRVKNGLASFTSKVG